MKTEDIDAAPPVAGDRGAMTDEELAIELCPDNPCLGLMLVCGMTTRRRGEMEHLVIAGRELALWAEGISPRPPGMIVTRAKGRARIWGPL